MGLFICAKCNCIENTALGWWWSRNNLQLLLPPDMKEFEKGKGLCSECLPIEATYSDGTGKGEIGQGKWHGKWTKIHYNDWKNTVEGMMYVRYKDQLIYKPNPNS